jgi:ubiquinone/menaquinone biosynthesis C-methylase UbiE
MVDKRTVRRSYDALADAYAAERAGGGPEMALLDDLLDDLPAGARVLDAGCGNGEPVLRAVAAEAEPVGVDVSHEQLRRTAANVPSAAVTQGDMAALPLRDDSVDAVVAFWSLIHVPFEEHAAVAAEFARVVRPGGYALVCEGTGSWEGENPDWLDGGAPMEWNMAGAETTREQLRDAGFTIEAARSVPDSLEDDPDEPDPWTFLLARRD